MRTIISVKKLVLTAAVSSLLAFNATAIVSYNFNYSDSAGNVANGLLTGNEGPVGTVTVTSGYFNGTAGGILGIYSLFPNPNAPGTVVSPSGFFQIDDLLFPAANPKLDTWGLLFTSGAAEVNLWGNGPGQYQLYGHNLPGDYDSGNVTATLGLSLVPVPETSFFAVAGVGLLGLVYIGRRYLQKAKFA